VIRSEVSDNHGQLHGGFGHQYNFILQGERLIRRGPDPQHVAKDHLNTLNRQYVEPDGYPAAQDALDTHGCVILIGAAGIGKRATGRVLLRRLGGAASAVQEESGLPPWRDDVPLDSRGVTEGDLILLDPRDAPDADVLGAIMRRLPYYRAELRERGASLVVALGEWQRYLAPHELRPQLVTLARPDGADVVQRHLAVAGIAFTEEQLHNSTRLTSRLGLDPMERLAELASLVTEARDRLGPAAGFPAWRDAALEVLDEPDSAVAQFVAGLPGAQRALLLAAAMLADAPADQVDVVGTALAAIAARPGDERPPLERTGLTQRLAELEIDVESGHIRFRRFEHERAVRRYFWDDFAALRTSFRCWAEGVATTAEIAAHLRERFVAHFAEQALRTDRPADITGLVKDWLDGQGPRRLTLPAAAQALEVGLGDERHGARFRALIYEWSLSSSISRGTASVGITSCAGAMASTHPAEAVVRLHHFARQPDPRIREEATDALRQLVREDPRQFRRLLHRVVAGLADPRFETDFALFLVLTRPATQPPADAFTRDRLTTGWQAVLFHRPTAEWADVARECLDAAEAAPHRTPWLRLLARAADRPGPGTGRLYVVARDWARTPGADQRARTAIALELTRRTRPARPGSHEREEEPVR
jgi:hypothetical protein